MLSKSSWSFRLLRLTFATGVNGEGVAGRFRSSALLTTEPPSPVRVGGVARGLSSKGGRHVRSTQAHEFEVAASQSVEAASASDEVSESSSRRTRPRRLKSFSDAIDSIGSSFHNISQHLKKHRSSLSKANSTATLPDPAENHQDTSPSLKGKRNGHAKSTRSLFAKSRESSKSNSFGSDSSPPPLTITTLPRASKSSSVPSRFEMKQQFQPIKSSQTPKSTTTPPNFIEVQTPAYKQPDERRNSMIWVDYLTAPGINVNGSHEDGTDSESACASDEDLEIEPEKPVEGAVGEFANRKIWFNKAIEDLEEEFDEDDSIENDGNGKPKFCKRQLTGGFESPRNNFFRRIRKDSIALSIKSRGSGRSPMPPDGSNQHRNVDDLIFDMFREKDEEVAIAGTFLAALAKTGLRKDDPRLAEMFDNLRRVHKDQEANFPGRIGSIETLRLDRETFKVIITDNIVLISKAFRQQFVIPEFQTFCGHLEEMYWRCRDVKGGKVAGYIPQLARVDPTLWGVSICTIDGQRYSIGDTMIPFTIQSCSKPLTYAIALNELGEDTVHQYVGQEPSGRMFNELVLDYNKKPHNPMVNAGAIIVCSLLKSMVRPEMSLAEKFDYTHNYFKKLCGGEYVGFNNAVFLSERDAADRNYALGFYMRENKCFPEGTSLQECMDYYFQICSMECNCEAMSVMAATLANGGICPVSGEKVLKSESVRDVLSLMHSCGMYDYSGQFAFKVGLPAKSGVSGAIMLVVPNVFGMAVWSPPLDVLGNSLRGVALCQELVSVFNFHKYDNLRHASDKLDPRRHRYETKGLNIVNLLFSAASGDVTSMRRHHLSGMDMNASDYDGRTALHLAAAEGHLECVQYLLRHCHVSHSPLDRWGHLPVDDATKFEHEDVAEFLKKWAGDNPD